MNDLHKQMLRVSAKVEAMAAGPGRDRAIDHLYQGQSNDCYWHGLFGGVYISHMRLATHEHLIAAEDLADRAAGALDAAETLDLDLDGADEVRLATAGQVVTVDLDDGAGIGDWDVRAARHAVTAVLRRRPEAYHAKITEDGDDDGANEWQIFRRIMFPLLSLPIAGTYTPFALMKMDARWGLTLLAVVWTMAAIGIAIKLFAPRYLEGVTTALYLVQGWAVIVAWHPLVSAVPERVAFLLMLGGVLYTIGVVFHLWERLPFQNAIWHGFVLVAASCSLCGRDRHCRLLSAPSDALAQSLNFP